MNCKENLKIKTRKRQNKMYKNRKNKLWKKK